MGDLISKNCCSDNSNVVTCENVSSLMNSYILPESQRKQFFDNEEQIVKTDLRPISKPMALDFDPLVFRMSDHESTPASGERKSFKRSTSNKIRNGFLKKAKHRLFSPTNLGSSGFNGVSFSVASSAYEGNFDNYILRPSGDLDSDVDGCFQLSFDVN